MLLAAGCGFRTWGLNDFDRREVCVFPLVAQYFAQGGSHVRKKWLWVMSQQNRWCYRCTSASVGHRAIQTNWYKIMTTSMMNSHGATSPKLSQDTSSLNAASFWSFMALSACNLASLKRDPTMAQDLTLQCLTCHLTQRKLVMYLQKQGNYIRK